jgi:DNA-binding MarR family transcriptional regulator
VNLNQPAGGAAQTTQNGVPRGLALVVAAESLPWPRRLGPLAWTALQHLALSSHHTEQGRAVPVGVRDLAAGLGVTKDTAARAVSRLVAEGLVTREPVGTRTGYRRSGYLLHLPEAMRVIDRLDHLRAADDQPAIWRAGDHNNPRARRSRRVSDSDTRTGIDVARPRESSGKRRLGQPPFFTTTWPDDSVAPTSETGGMS